MRKLLLTGAVLALIPVGARAQITTPDLAFINEATHADMTEVQEGHIAQTNAANPAVKAFGQRMVEDHSIHNQQLTAMLQQAQIALPPSSAPDQVNQADLLRQQTGPDFDRAYLQAQIANHQHMLVVLQGEIQNGTDVNLKAFAQQSLPIVQAHLVAAQQLLGAG